jgi:hypothetical protein
MMLSNSQLLGDKLLGFKVVKFIVYYSLANDAMYCSRDAMENTLVLFLSLWRLFLLNLWL